MSTASDHAAPLPPPSAPSVFISYASEDRAAARLIRDALSAAGLEVWYDENELGGGDAWDQKIRRQIRDCEYFMPVISAATQARKEGYFRREWRLAVERTMDMADDVLFLIPVTIDATNEANARVPDKFLHVQWLRLPGGQPTPALHHLVRRILSGDHHALTRPPMAFNRPSKLPRETESPSAPGGMAAEKSADAPPSMPPFPHPPEKGGFGHTLRFLAEAFWWLLTAAWLLFKRLPKWARLMVSIWIAFTALSTCSPRQGKTITFGDARNADTQKAIKAAAEQLNQAARDVRKNRNLADPSRGGNEAARGPGPGAADNAAAGKRLLLMPFARISSEEPAAKFAGDVFDSVYGHLVITHSNEVGLLRRPPTADDAALFASAKQLGASFILLGRITGEGDARALLVRLLVVEDSSTKWTDSYPLKNAEAAEVADKITDKALEELPRRGGPPRQKQP